MLTLDQTFEKFKEIGYKLPNMINQEWEIDQETYWYFLEILPPLDMGRGWFLMCEFANHTEEGIPVTSLFYSAGMREDKKYYHRYIVLKKSILVNMEYAISELRLHKRRNKNAS